MIHIYDVTITRNVGELVKVKTTHGSKMLPKVKKYIKNIKIYRNSIPQSCLVVHLIFVPFETAIQVTDPQKHIYLDEKRV